MQSCDPLDIIFGMITGFEKIVEERIRRAQEQGAFEDLPGKGAPLKIEDDRHIPEDLRLAHKILKNADCKPPEVELKEKIAQAEDLLAGMEDTREKYRLLKKLNFMIMKLNSMRDGCVEFEVPQKYTARVVDRLASKAPPEK